MKKPLLAILLILSFALSQAALAEAQTKTSYTLALQGPTWDHSTITVLIVAAYNESWWNPAYLNASLMPSANGTRRYSTSLQTTPISPIYHGSE
jgi:hypothetical protein